MKNGIEKDAWEQKLAIKEEKDRLRRVAFTALLANTIPANTDTEAQRFYTVANIGCRDGSDTVDIRDACAIRGQVPQILGIEFMPSWVEFCSETYADANTKFICADAADPAVTALYPRETNLILLRHSEITKFAYEVQIHMLRLALSCLKPSAQILITVYNSVEYELFQRVLKYLDGIQVDFSGENPFRDKSLEQWNNRTDTLNCPDWYMIRMTKV